MAQACPFQGRAGIAAQGSATARRDKAAAGARLVSLSIQHVRKTIPALQGDPSFRTLRPEIDQRQRQGGFSVSVMELKKASDRGRTPMSRRRRSVATPSRPEMFMPSTRMRPWCTGRSPLLCLNSVDFPQPLTPTIQRTYPPIHVQIHAGEDRMVPVAGHKVIDLDHGIALSFRSLPPVITA